MPETIFDPLKYAREKFREYYFERKAIRNFVVGWVKSSYTTENLGCVTYIQLCDHEIRNNEDFDRWMTRIQLRPGEKVIYYDIEEHRFRDFEEVFNDVLKDDNASLDVCVRVLGSDTERYLLVRVLDDTFLYWNTEEARLAGIRKHKYRWLSGDEAKDLQPLNSKKSLVEALLKLC